jgi:hypothetical protein
MFALPRSRGRRAPRAALFVDGSPAATISTNEFFGVPAAPAGAIYLGASGESVIRVGTRSAAALYVGARSLF